MADDATTEAHPDADGDHAGAAPVVSDFAGIVSHRRPSPTKAVAMPDTRNEHGVRSHLLARVGDLEICYETFGDPSDPALLLVVGFGGQLTDWDISFCRALADAGFYVIRYDHRDVGLSSKLDDQPPDLEAFARGDHGALVYGLDDMADDGIGLVHSLGFDRVHVIGRSMGGMIGQLMAIRHPDVVVSLCSIMSTTGASTVGRPKPEVLATLAAPVPEGRQNAVEHALHSHRLVNGGRYPVDEEATRGRAAEAYDRCHYPAGRIRQRMAVRFAPDRTQALGRLRVPVVVIHGDADPLVSVTGGIATAEAIPGAELVVIPGLGHEFPAELHGRFVEEFARNARRRFPAPLE